MRQADRRSHSAVKQYLGGLLSAQWKLSTPQWKEDQCICFSDLCCRWVAACVAKAESRCATAAAFRRSSVTAREAGGSCEIIKPVQPFNCNGVASMCGMALPDAFCKPCMPLGLKSER